MKWLLYWPASIVVTLLAVVLSPVLPAFSRGGWLPLWLWWFQTPDNDLDGDRSDWTGLPVGSYLRRVLWLLRNPAYGFEIDVVGARIQKTDQMTVKGDPWIKNRKDAKAGWYWCQINSYWNLKVIYQITQETCFMLELGWKLQPYAQHGAPPNTEHAQLVFSPRISAFYASPA